MKISFTDLANDNIRHLAPYVPGKPINELQRELGIKDIIKLASNENPLGPSPKALAALQYDAKNLALYPDGSGYELKQTLAQYWNIPPECITLGNGSDALFVLLGLAFVKPGQQIIVSQYSFATFTIAARIVDAEVVTVPAKNWGHDLDATLKAITTDTRLIFMANPNNPTGSWHTTSELVQFMEKLPSHILVMLDEAYAEYMIDMLDYPNGIALQRQYPNLIVTRTFSKIYGLAGLRIGYGISHPEIADMLNRVRLPFNVSSSGMVAAAAALHDNVHIENTLKTTRTGMQYLKESFNKLGIDYLPPCGNFITIKVKQDGMKLYRSLLQAGIIVRPLVNYDMPNYLRITVGTSPENKRFIQTLQTLL